MDDDGRGGRSLDPECRARARVGGFAATQFEPRGDRSRREGAWRGVPGVSRARRWARDDATLSNN